MDGFDLGVIDYLLKPISFERFLQAISKYKNTQQLLNYPSKNRSQIINLKSDRKTYKVNLSDIFFIEGMGNYVQVFLKRPKTGRVRQIVYINGNASSSFFTHSQILYHQFSTNRFLFSGID